MSWFEKQLVVAPFDFSDQALEGVRTALQLTDSPANVHVVHVLPKLSPTDPGVIWDAVDEEDRVGHAETAIRDKLAEHGIQGVSLDVPVGDASTEIAELAEKIDAGLIVMTSHGRTGFRRLLIGSVAERVVRLAHCAVLVLKEESKD